MSFNVNWFAVAALVMEVESGISAIKSAVGVDQKTSAIAELTKVVVHGIEDLTGKDLVSDAGFNKLVSDVVAAIADAQSVKP